MCVPLCRGSCEDHRFFPLLSLLASLKAPAISFRALSSPFTMVLCLLLLPSAARKICLLLLLFFASAITSFFLCEIRLFTRFFTPPFCSYGGHRGCRQGGPRLCGLIAVVHKIATFKTRSVSITRHSHSFVAVLDCLDWSAVKRKGLQVNSKRMRSKIRCLTSETLHPQIILKCPNEFLSISRAVSHAKEWMEDPKGLNNWNGRVESIIRKVSGTKE